MSTVRRDPSDSRAQAGAGLRWTGHPLVDMGIATLVAFTGRDQPDDVTYDDLEQFASYAEESLLSPALRSLASVLYTINNDYLNPSLTDDRRRAKARGALLRFVSPPEPGLPACTYCRRPAAKAASTSALAYRDVVPMLTGRGVINFFPYGAHGLPLCGLCNTALQALVIGAPSCEGRALVVESDDPRQLIALIRSWLPDVRARIQLSTATGQKVDAWSAPRTRLIDRLVDLERRHRLPSTVARFIIYHLSNSCQGPAIDIHRLQAPAVSFLRRAQGAAYHQAWTRVARHAWLDADRRRAERDPDDAERPLWRNHFYDALFQLPDNARAFVARFFLAPQRRSTQEAGDGDHVPLWRLVELFVKEVLAMEQPRIDAIRTLADEIAVEVSTNDDRKLFQRAYQVRGYQELRRLLIQCSFRRISRGLAPLLSFEDFLTLFEVGDELPRTDWRLAWDLVLIRVIDQLHASNWFRKHREAVEVAAEEEQAIEAEEGDNRAFGLSQSIT